MYLVQFQRKNIIKVILMFAFKESNPLKNFNTFMIIMNKNWVKYWNVNNPSAKNRIFMKTTSYKSEHLLYCLWTQLFSFIKSNTKLFTKCFTQLLKDNQNSKVYHKYRKFYSIWVFIFKTVWLHRIRIALTIDYICFLCE